MKTKQSLSAIFGHVMAMLLKMPVQTFYDKFTGEITTIRAIRVKASHILF